MKTNRSAMAFDSMVPGEDNGGGLGAA